jgi:nucleotide-binding universal stress UspA family protein
LGAVKTYVVGLDGSEHARDALKWARAVATADARIVAVHSWEIPIVTGYEAVTAVDTTAVEQAAKEFLTGAIGESDDRRIEGRLVTGHPGRALVETAAELGQDAVVVVGHGGSSKAALLLGSTANYVIHHTKAPVVVVRGACRLPVRHVVVGVDDPHRHEALDPPSLAALKWAVELEGVERVEVHHSEFVPTVVAGPLSQPGTEAEEAEEHDVRLLRESIARATGGSGDAPNGAAVVPVLSSRNAAFDLIEASRDADLVVIGSRGRPGLLELLAGATSLEVTAHCHCPVAVLR